MSGGMNECFHCCTNSVIWDSDFNYEDMGYEGEGVVHICHCTNCGAEIIYKVSIPDENTNDTSEEHTD